MHVYSNTVDPARMPSCPRKVRSISDQASGARVEELGRLLEAVPRFISTHFVARSSRCMRSFGRVTPKAWILSAHSSRHHARKRAPRRARCAGTPAAGRGGGDAAGSAPSLLRPRVADGLAAVQEQVDALGVGDFAGLGQPDAAVLEAKSSISPRSRGSSHAWQRSVANPSGSVHSSASSAAADASTRRTSCTATSASRAADGLLPPAAPERIAAASDSPAEHAAARRPLAAHRPARFGVGLWRADRVLPRLGARRRALPLRGRRLAVVVGAH